MYSAILISLVLVCTALLRVLAKESSTLMLLGAAPISCDRTRVTIYPTTVITSEKLLMYVCTIYYIQCQSVITRDS